MWPVWGTKTKHSFFATDQPVDKPWTNRGTTSSKSHGKTQKSRGKTQTSRGRGDQISQTGICCVLSIDTNNSWIKCTGLLVGSMWDRARNLGNMYLHVFTFMFPFCIGNIEVRGDPGQTLGKKMLSHIAAPSASLQSNGTENRPFRGICQRYLWCLLLLKQVFGERSSKARSFDFRGIYIYIVYYGSNSEIKIRWVGVETYLRKSLDSTPEHDLVCGQWVLWTKCAL